MAWSGAGWGTVGLVLILGFILVALLASAGLALVLAGRSVESSEEPSALASIVDDGLGRTRTAVETLVTPEVREADLRPSPSAHHNRGATYAVFGIGLVGIAAFIIVGSLLLAG